MPRPFAPTDRTRVRRRPQRGVYDRDVVDAVLDEALVCHVGFVADGQPYVLPTIHVRVGDTLYLHGAVASRMLGTAAGAPLCVTVTLLDGLVMARSAFHHSMNYRSVVVLGTGREVVGEDERLLALRALVEHVAAGRWDEVRPPSAAELRATRVVAVSLDEVSAKVRTGPPIDDDEDMALDVWAGELPLAQAAAGPPRPDPQLDAGVSPGPSIAGWAGAGGLRARSST